MVVMVYTYISICLVLLFWVVLLGLVGVVLGVVVQVTAWIHTDLNATLPIPFMPGHYGHSGNEQFSVRLMGRKPSALGRYQMCITCFDVPSMCLVFGVLYRWWTNIECDHRGWRMIPVRFFKEG